MVWKKILPKRILLELKKKCPKVKSAIWNALFRHLQQRVHAKNCYHSFGPHYHHLSQQHAKQKKKREKKLIDPTTDFEIQYRSGGGKGINIFAQSKVGGVEETAIQNQVKKIQEALKDDAEDAAKDLKEVEENVYGDIKEAHMSSKMNLEEKEVALKRVNQVYDALIKFIKVFKNGFKKSFYAIWDMISDMTQSESYEKEQKTNQAIHDELVYDIDKGKKGSWYESIRNGLGSLWSSTGKKLLNSAADWLQWGVSKVIWVAGWAVTLAYKGLLFAFGKASNFVNWIVNNPKTSKMALMIGRMIKKVACKQIGLFITHPEDYEAKSSENFSFNAEQAYQIGNEIMSRGASAAVKAAPSIAKQFGTAMIDGLSNSVPFIGAFIKPLAAVVLDSAADAASEAIEFYQYYSNVTQSFTYLIDLLDPRDCLQQMCSVHTEYAEILTDSVKNITNVIHLSNEEVKDLVKDHIKKNNGFVSSACYYLKDQNFFKAVPKQPLEQQPPEQVQQNLQNGGQQANQRFFSDLALNS